MLNFVLGYLFHEDFEFVEIEDAVVIVVGFFEELFYESLVLLGYIFVGP